MRRDAESARGDNPVQFEREDDEQDPFGLDQFLETAKKGKQAMASVGGGGTMSASAGARSADEMAQSGRGREKVDFRGSS